LRLHEAGGERDGDGLTAADRAFVAGGETGHLDLPRARAGGLVGGVFAIFPAGPPHGDDDYARPADQATALSDTLAMMARLRRLERAGALRVVRAARDLDAEDGGLAAVAHIEGAEPIGAGLDEFEVLHEAGLRSVGLTWSRPNRFATGVPLEFPGSPDQGPGLTADGRALVAACSALGVLVDCAHLNARGFWDVAELTDGPLVVSHANAHRLCASPRNLTDEQLRAVGEHGGVVGLNFHVGFVRADGADDDTDVPLAQLAAHAAHIADQAGVEAVGLGSDFDGATMPDQLADASRLPALLDALRAAGFGEDDVRKIAWENWRRVLGACLDGS
jgi:membrane dipeptidase